MRRAVAMILAVLMILQLLPVTAETYSDWVQVLPEETEAPQAHTVRFIADGEEIISIFVTDGGMVEVLPDAPAAEGKEFLGWYDADSLFTADAVITEDKELEAKYQDAQEEEQQQDEQPEVQQDEEQNEDEQPEAQQEEEQQQDEQPEAQQEEEQQQDEQPEAQQEEEQQQDEQQEAQQQEDQSAVDFIFPGSTVYLKDIASALGLSISNNSTLSVDTPLIRLSDTTVKNKNKDTVTLTADGYFDRAVLTIQNNKNDVQTVTLAYPRPDVKQIEYTFEDENDYVSLLSLLTDYTVAIDEAVVTAGDETAIELLDLIGDYSVVPTQHFDALTLTVTTREGAQCEIILHFPGEEEAPLVEGALYYNQDLYLTGKIPGNGVIDVTPVTVSIDGAEVLAAYDIKIYSNENQQKKGKTWQPADQKVQVHFFNEAFVGKLDVFHIDDAAPEYVATVTAEDGWVTFEAGSFSTYAVTQAIEKTVEIGGNTYNITVTFCRDAGIPDGAELAVAEVSADAYLAQAASALGMGAEDEFHYAKFLDIAIVYNGEEIEPNAPVDVAVSLLDVTDGAEALEVVHFDNGDQASKLESSADDHGTVTFTTSSFSVFGFGSILRSLLSWADDAVSYTLQGFSSLLRPTYTAITVALEEGLEEINAYTVQSRLGALLNALYVKVSTALSLGARESVVVYAVKDGQIADVLAEGGNVDESIALGNADGFAVVKDTGYRRKSFDLGDVELNGMMPKAAEAEATAATPEVDGEVLAAFDIKIEENGADYQPDSEHPVEVSIAVGETTGDLHVYHILDDGTQEEITDFDLVDGKVVFTAKGFSVYAVTELTSDFLASDGTLYQVTVYFDEAETIPANSTLRIEEIPASTEEYNKAFAALYNEIPEGDVPMLAVDISIIAPNGQEIEPVYPVRVKLIRKQLPDGTTAEELQDNVTISHLKEVGGGIRVDQVATGSDVRIDERITSEFVVDSFSTFAITYTTGGWWPTTYTLNAQLVDTNGNSIGNGSTQSISNATSVRNLAPSVSGYTFSKATIGGVNGTTIQRIQYINGWQYNTSASGGTWRSIGNNTVSFVYEQDSPYVKVYVYVAAYDQEGHQFKDNPEFLELLGISGDTVDGNGYFPVGEIYLDKSFFNGKTTEKWRALINSASDWEDVLAALGELNTSTLTYDSYNTPTDYSLNQGNSVGEYLSQAIGDVNKGAGSQCTALFGWSGHSYGFEDQTVQYHLDLRFQTNKVTFITGNNGIRTGASKDGTTVDTRAYITGSPIQQPRNLVIPAGYRLVGYYNDPDFTTPWDKIGTPITQDEVVYIKITPQDNVLLYYKPIGGGTVSLDAEGLNPETGTPRGSTATPNPGYTFVGWYADEACTQLLSTDPAFVPTKTGSRWIDGTTYYAKFVEDSVTLRFIAEENIDHVELVTDAGEVISVTGDGTKEMTVNISKQLGPAVTVRGVAEDGYVVKEWTIDGRTGALTTNEAINTTITDDPSATTQWTDRTYRVWAETGKQINVSKQVETVGTVLKSDIDVTVYFALKRKDTGDWVRKDGDIWVQSINVVDGVPQSPNNVTFDGLASGTYEVWEVADPNASSLKPGDIVIERDSQQKEVLVATIHTVHNGSNSNNITLSDSNRSDSMTVVNTYSHREEYKDVTARKYWYTTPNLVQEGQQNQNVPAGAWAELTLYNGEEAVRTIRLDGVVDEDGETSPWEATFDGVGNVDSAGNTITYTIRETGYSNPLNGQYYYQVNAEAREGGAVSNAVLYGNVNVYKQIEVQPRNNAMDALVRQGLAALQIHLTGPYGYDETFTFQDPADPYNPSLNIPDLPAGRYYIEELNYVDLITGRKWNPTDSWIKVEKMSRDDDGIVNVEQKGTTGSYIYVGTDGHSNDSTDVRFRNDYLKYDVTATKVWKDNGIENADHPAVNFTLYQIDAEGNRRSISTKIIGANQTGEGLTVKWEQLEQQEQQYTYEIEEAPVEGYICESVTGDMFTGFTVTNTRLPEVTLKKLVTGNMGDLSKDFAFTISVTKDGGNVPYKVDDVQKEDTAEFTLHHDQSAKLNLPIGATVTITEVPDGYTLTSAEGATGGTLSENVYSFTVTADNSGETVTFTNDLSQNVDTGVQMRNAPYGMMLGLCLLGGALMLYARRRRGGESE